MAKTTREAILERIAKKEISVADGMALLAAEDKSNGGSPPAKRHVKLNSKGGLFIRDTQLLRDVSKEGKPYGVSLNITPGAAVGLFQLDKDGRPSELLREVCEFTMAHVKRPAALAD